MPIRSARRNAKNCSIPDGSNVVPNDIIKVAVVDDHPILCAGVAETFDAEPGFEVVAIGSNAADALRIARSTAPDLMIVDINMPGDIFSVLQTVRDQSLAIKTIVLTAFDDDYYLGKALRNGASGYILKGISSSELIETTRAVMAGAIMIPQGANDPLTKDAPALKDDVVGDLTAREEDILLLVSRGLNNAEIGVELGISEATVKKNLTAVLQKLNLRNRVEAAIFAGNQYERRRSE